MDLLDSLGEEFGSKPSIYVPLTNLQTPGDAARVWGQAATVMDVPKMDDPAGSLIREGKIRNGCHRRWAGLALRAASKHPVITDDHNVKHSGLRALRLDFDQENISGFVRRLPAGVCRAKDR